MGFVTPQSIYKPKTPLPVEDGTNPRHFAIDRAWQLVTQTLGINGISWRYSERAQFTHILDTNSLDARPSDLPAYWTPNGLFHGEPINTHTKGKRRTASPINPPHSTKRGQSCCNAINPHPCPSKPFSTIAHNIAPDRTLRGIDPHLRPKERLPLAVTVTCYFRS